MVDIVCFAIIMLISLGAYIFHIKIKPPGWRLYIAWVMLMDFLGVLLLVSRLTSGR